MGVQCEFIAEREQVDTMEFGIPIFQHPLGQHFEFFRAALPAAVDLSTTVLRKLNDSLLPHVTSDCELTVTPSHFRVRNRGSWRHFLAFRAK